MNTELEKLQGTWKIVALEVEGAKMGEHMFKESKILVKGTRFNTISMGATYAGTVVVDALSTPKRLDLVFSEGPHQGSSALAIYEVVGDTWKMCMGFAGKDRPEAFVSTAKSGHALETLQREAEAL